MNLLILFGIILIVFGELERDLRKLSRWLDRLGKV